MADLDAAYAEVMTQPADGPKRGPSPWWFAVAAAVFVIGLVPLGWTFVNTVHGVATYEVHDFGSSTSVALDVEGDQTAIFTTYRGAGTVRCNGKVAGEPAQGDTDIAQMEYPWSSLTITRGGTEWHRVAVTPEAWPDGEYVVECNVGSPASGNPEPTLAYADNPSILSTVVGFLIALGIAGLAAVVAITIAVVVGVKRIKAIRTPGPAGPVFPSEPPPAQ